MNAYDQKKLIQVVLYVLNQTGGVDYYHLFKILYFAERGHLAKWGHRITSDDFYALEYGPVPTCLYDAVKRKGLCDAKLADELEECVEFAGNDAPNVLLAKQPADADYLSKSEIEALDESIKENLPLSFGQLKSKSHDSAWSDAYRHGSRVISPVKMAVAANADNVTVEYIKEQMELESALA